MSAEKLLAGTQAIPRGQLEMIEWSGPGSKSLKWLVRYRTITGENRQQTFPRDQTDQAFHLFSKWCDELRRATGHPKRRHVNQQDNPANAGYEKEQPR